MKLIIKSIPLLTITLILLLPTPIHANPPIFGNIDPPPATGFIPLEGTGGTPGGLVRFISRIVQLFFVGSGLFVFFNIIFAGYKYLTADGNPQNLQQANAKIYQSFIGAIIIASSLLITTIISWIIFGEPGFILNPTIATP